MLTDTDKYLIKCELSDDVKYGFNFKYKKLSNKFIDWLFNHYYTVEFSIRFYDVIDENSGIRKLDFCSWTDPFGKGIWNMSQRAVDETSRNRLKNLRGKSISKRERLYFAEKDGYILIFWYGRDVCGEDYWWIFRKNGLKNEGWRF